MSITGVSVEGNRAEIRLDSSDQVRNLQNAQTNAKPFNGGGADITRETIKTPDGGSIMMVSAAHKDTIPGISTNGTIEFFKTGSGFDRADVVAIGQMLKDRGMVAEAPNVQLTLDQAVNEAARN